jgi:hypothetical protein
MIQRHGLLGTLYSDESEAEFNAVSAALSSQKAVRGKSGCK